MDVEERIRESFKPLLSRDDLATIEQRGMQRRRSRRRALAIPVVAAATAVALFAPNPARRS